MSTEPTRPHDLPLLDGLRAVAALMVLATHVAFQTGTVTRGAWGALLARFDFGVALFFVLSGFLLVRPWLRAAATGGAAPRGSTYLLRRAARILPAYWLVLAVVLTTTARGAGVGPVLSNLALVQVYPGDLLDGLTQTWSLCTEAAFYLLLPLVAVYLSHRSVRRALPALAGLAVVSWVWTALAAGGALPARSSTWLPGHLDWFAVGLALAMLDQHVRSHPDCAAARRVAELGRHPWTLLSLAGAIFWFAATPVGGPATLAPVAPATATLKEALYATAAGLVLAAVAFAPQRTGGLSRALGSRSAQAAGRVSYGVFLWHLVILAGVLDLLGLPLFTGGFWRAFVLTTAASLAVAAASWRLVEAPILAAVHRKPLVPAPEAAPVAQPR